MGVEALESDFYFHSVDNESDSEVFSSEKRLPNFILQAFNWWPLILPIGLAIVFKFISIPSFMVRIYFFLMKRRDQN